MFWAPTLTELPRSSWDAKWRRGNGGQTAVSTPSTPSVSARMARHSSTHVRDVVFIFQLPATSGRRMGFVLGLDPKGQAPYLVRRRAWARARARASLAGKVPREPAPQADSLKAPAPSVRLQGEGRRKGTGR